MKCYYCKLEIRDGEKSKPLCYIERGYEIEITIDSHQECFDRHVLDRAIERAREQETGQNEEEQ